ncbi:MAG: DUF2776 domain-containing protein [Alistipes senegalensis]|nr:DUF2776 domain-containing protein [Bacteroides cellulosilyticus]MCM1352314.1 DUF2776 domain-containing protein [Alistipes senegalensis]
MNHGISMLFRAIPLAMAALCFAYGAYVFGTGDAPARFTAGPVVFFLGAICIALYCTAATIIRQIIGTYTAAAKYLFPALGYMCALLTLVCGILILFSHWPGAAVTGHVVCGLSLITVCVSTAATASTRFLLIPGNSADPQQAVNPAGFTAPQVRTLTAVPCIAAAIAWGWALLLLRSHTTAHIVAGCVMLGIACVCTSLIALVASIARQIRGSYGMNERRRWITLVLVMGAAAFLMGILAFILFHHKRIEFVGFVLIGLALICWSISSKVILLAKIWRAEFPLAVRIPIIPVITALTCLFLAAFLFEETPYAPEYFVPSRVLVGFGAVCFTLYSIVSILESGTSRKE